MKNDLVKTELGILPSYWKVELLDKVADRKSGHTPNKKNDSYWNGDIPWISLKDLSRLNNRYVYETTDYTTIEGINNSSAVLLPKGTIVISRDASVGKVGITSKQMATSQHFINYICGENLDNIYLYYYLLFNDHIFKQIATGSTIKTIGLDFFKKFKVALPPIQEQKQIGKILSTWDKAIEVKEKLIEQKKEQKKGLMERLLTGKQRLKGFEEEWKLKKVKDIAEIYLGLTYTPKYVSEGVPFLSVKDLDGDKLDFSNIKYISREEFESSTSNAKPLKGDILFGRVGTLGNPIVLNEDIEFCIFVSLGFLRMKNESSLNYFVKYWMQSNLFKKQIESQVAGSSQKNLNTGWLKEFELKMPNVIEQKAIVKVLSGMDKEVNLLKQELQLLKQQRRALMQQLLTGKIRVKI